MQTRPLVRADLVTGVILAAFGLAAVVESYGMPRLAERNINPWTAPGVVPGLLIKTLEGIFLYGTNSFIASAGRVRLAARAGEVRRFRFSLPLALNAGYYRLSFGISAGDPLAELTPLDRRYDAVLIQCGRELPFWGLADLGASFDELPGGTVARTTRGIIAP